MIYNHKGFEIEMFDSIQNLPILRFQKFNKYQMIASEIGNTFTDYDQRTVKALQFMKKKMYNEALQELENRRLTVFNSFNEFTPTGKSFAVLVKRIHKTEYKDFTPDDLDRCLKHLESIGFEFGKSIEKLKEVKKKSKRNWLYIIHNIFRRTGTKIKQRYASSG